MTPAEFAAKIDHTVLKPEAASPDVHRAATEALQNGFASICVAGVWVSRVATMLQGAVPVCAVVGFPHGTSKSTVKAIEATSSIKDGASEIDVVAHLPHLIRADVDAARAELIEIVKAARATRRDVVVKVIIESAYLLSLPSDQPELAIAAACRATRESGCDFVKTSTGFHPAGGATVSAVQLIKKYSQDLKIKAAGGVRDLSAALDLLNAGADRLGCSSSMELLSALKSK